MAQRTNLTKWQHPIFLRDSFKLKSSPQNLIVENTHFLWSVYKKHSNKIKTIIQQAIQILHNICRKTILKMCYKILDYREYIMNFTF